MSDPDPVAHTAHVAAVAYAVRNLPVFLTVSQCAWVTGMSKAKIRELARDPDNPMPPFMRAPGTNTWRISKAVFLGWFDTWTSDPSVRSTMAMPRIPTLDEAADEAIAAQPMFADQPMPDYAEWEDPEYDDH